MHNLWDFSAPTTISATAARATLCSSSCLRASLLLVMFKGLPTLRGIRVRVRRVEVRIFWPSQKPLPLSRVGVFVRVSQGCWVKKIQILWNHEITCIVISRVSFGSVVTTCDIVSFLPPAPSLSQHDDHNLTNDEHHPSSKQPQPPTVDNHPSCPTSAHPGNNVAHQRSIQMCHIIQPSPIHDSDNKKTTTNNNGYGQQWT